MCPKCNKAHAADAQCVVARKPEEILADIERGVNVGREDSRKLKETLDAALQRVDALESKLKKRSVNLPGVDEEKDEFSFARLCVAIARHDDSVAPFETSVCKEAAKKRDMSSGVDSAGGYLVPNEFSNQLIELLRAKMVTEALGITALRGMTGGAFFIPKQTGSATVYWTAENATITPSDASVGQIEMRPRELGALVPLSNRLLRLSNPGAEAMVRNDLAAIFAREIDKVVMFGTGGTKPLGIIYSSGIGTKTVNAIPTLDDLYDMIAQIETANADQGNLGWAMNPSLWNVLRKIKDGDGKYVLTPDSGAYNVTSSARPAARGMLLGYPFATSTQVPTNFGTGTDRTALIFGNWADAVLAEWAGLELKASDVAGTSFAANQTWIRALTEVDFNVRHGASFSVDTTVKLS